MNIQPGDTVFFLYNGERRYLKIHTITMTADGLMAKFDPGCACKAMLKPIDKVYKVLEDFLAAIERGEA